MSDNPYLSPDVDDEVGFDDDIGFEPSADEENYRSVSKYAAFSLTLAVMSFTGLLFPAFTIFGLAAIVLGVLGRVSISRYPLELTGIKLANMGMVFGGVLFVVANSLHIYEYMTELPEGYMRVSFYDLQPERGSPLPISEMAIRELDGKKIFIKGYVHPGVDGMGATNQFVMVRDMGTCCFGGQPKVADMIEVTLQDPHRIKYSTRRRKLGGILTIVPPHGEAIGDLEAGYFKLDADYLK